MVDRRRWSGDRGCVRSRFGVLGGPCAELAESGACIDRGRGYVAADDGSTA